MDKKILKERSKEYVSLYDEFKPGERVIRHYKKKSGEVEEYEGIIMAMDQEYMEVYWDTIDGQYCPDQIVDDFTLCDADEVFNGSEDYSPIQHKKKKVSDYLDII